MWGYKQVQNYYYSVQFNITPQPKEKRLKESGKKSIHYGFRKCGTRLK